METHTSARHEKTPPPRAKRRSRTKQTAIQESAASLAAEIGYHAATIEGVAARAGVGKQTIYRWWPSKAALFAEVYATLVPPTALEADTGCVADDLLHLLQGLFRIYRRLPAAAILAGLIADAQHDTAAAEALQSGLVLERQALLTDPLRRGVARGELDADFDVDWANEAIVSMVWRRLLTDRDDLTDRFADALVARVLKAAAP